MVKKKNPYGKNRRGSKKISNVRVLKISSLSLVQPADQPDIHAQTGQSYFLFFHHHYHPGMYGIWH